MVGTLRVSPVAGDSERPAVPDGRGIHVAMLVLNPFTHDTRVEKEAATLREAGYRVTVVARAEPGLPRDEWRDGVAVRRVIHPTWPGFVRYFLYRRRIVRVMRELAPDILHAHDTEALDVAGIAAGRLRVPLVYDAHELWLERVRRDRSRVYWALSRRYYSEVERRFLRRAAAHITVSEPIARHLERRYGLKHVAVVANYPPISAPPAPRDLRSLPGGGAIPPGAPIVLYVGNVLPGRGVEQLIRAMAMLPAAHLALLGSAEQREAVRRAAAAAGTAGRVHALPRVPSDEVVAYAASATVGVSPILPRSLSYRYSLPNKIFQYMAASIPVVASHFPQVRAVVEESGAGITVDPADPRDIARAVERYLADPGAAAAAGAAGRRAVEERYNWETAAAALRDVYDGVAKRLRRTTEG